MSPCCIAAAAATAVLTALIVVGLTGFVLVTDGFGLGLVVSTLLAIALQHLERIGPCPALLYALSGLLAVRAGYLLTTSRRALVLAVIRRVRSRIAAVRGRTLRAHSGHPGCARGTHACRAMKSK